MFSTDGVTRIAVGQPIGAFYGYEWTGLDAQVMTHSLSEQGWHNR